MKLRAVIRLTVLGAFLCARAHAGGPGLVAGSAFDPAKAGKPILWAGGNITYYTDQGDLSSLLLQADANAFVADAFARWTSVTTAALTATRAGSLSEDVNGANVIASDTGITLPADIQPSATTKPIAIVYDFDGQVTERLLGAGSSDPSLCATNSVLGGIDKLSLDAHIVHALIVINGRCAQVNGDLAPLKYRLVRAVGRALGLGWAQANDNVQTGTPLPSNSDLAGFPLMHAVDPFCTGLITTCLPNADQLRADDRAAIARLYPVTAENAPNFPGKQIFSSATARIHGSIYFPDGHGDPGQPMQGVNVVARLLDPATHIPSKAAVVTSVSGFLFRGNAGNTVSGFGTPQRLDSFGSADPALEGSFDLAGLEVPAGQATASFQITLEAINPLYQGDLTVGPYTTGMVTPSGSRQTLTVADLSAGADVQQDILMRDAPVSRPQDREIQLQRTVPASGDWWGTLSGYGRAEFYHFIGRADRSIDLQVTTLNESLRPTSNKAQPELGLWTVTDSLVGLPSTRVAAFNGISTGVTDLSANLQTSGSNQLAIVDYRGDGRPDFLYHAHFLYADSVSPDRIGSPNTTLRLKGIGFRPGMAVTVAGSPATVVGLSQNFIYVQSPAASDGLKNIIVTDPATGASSIMTNAVTYGTLSVDRISVSGSNPATAIGMTALNPLRVRVTASDGLTPLAGVPVSLSLSPNTSRIVDCGFSNCSLSTDANGEVLVYVTVNGSGANTLTASLSAGQQVSIAIVGTTATTLTAIVPTRRIISGTPTTQALTARLTSAGNPIGGQQVTYTITNGPGTLSSASGITDANGTVSANLTVTNVTATTAVQACAPAVSCALFTVQPILQSNIQLHKISGDGQMVASGQPFQPVTLRVTDSANPPNPLANVPVFVSGSVVAPSQHDCTFQGLCHPTMPHAHATFTTTLTSDVNGLATYSPTAQTTWGAVQVGIIATAGANASQNFNLQIFAPAP